MSRIPPASPAAIMFVKSGSKVFGCFRIASASDAPTSTSARVCRMTAAKFLSSSWLPRMSRHCTSGRPASIITENWRVKTARFLAATFLPVLPGLGLLLGLRLGLGLGRRDPRDQDLLAPQRGDGGVHGVGDPLAADRLSGARPSRICKV